jgi:tRNA G18 (ribose-2'-O)-methylase SpoU
MATVIVSRKKMVTERERGWLAALAAAAALLLHTRCRRCRSPPDFDTGEEIPGEAPRRLRKAETVLRRRTSRLLLVLEASYDMHNQAAVLRTADCLGIQHVWIVDPVRQKEQEPRQPLQPRQPRRHAPTRRARAETEQRAQVVAAMRERVDADAKAGGDSAGSEEDAPPDEPGGAREALSRKIARTSAGWLSVRRFTGAEKCVAALRAEGVELWVTALSQAARPVDDPALAVPAAPRRLAIAFGREADGASAALLGAADATVYLPMHGFSESLNLSVSAALVLQARRPTCALVWRRVLPRHRVLPCHGCSRGGRSPSDAVALEPRRRSLAWQAVLTRAPELRGAMGGRERAALRRQWFVRLAKSPAQVGDETPSLHALSLSLSLATSLSLHACRWRSSRAGRRACCRARSPTCGATMRRGRRTCASRPRCAARRQAPASELCELVVRLSRLQPA